ncbi:MAG: hypothetical protein B5M51_09050 [Anaerolinea sp. 4484_236]|nr:MAG: hypothetical protein B5M51_09050 [Anaerolinea sp. 4484_236]RLD06296.1 MAG: TIGR01906 family membrane protein [Chloroflexota bacterium]
MKIIQKIINTLTAIAVPVVISLGLVRLLLTPAFINLEYRMPYFPSDTFGFEQDERLRYAELSRQYLVNDAEVDFLGDLTFPDGGALFEERELSHMRDVKLVIEGVFLAFWGGAVVLALSTLWAWKRGSWSNYRQSLSWGGWLTVILLLTILVLSLLSFDALFVAFHRVFFEGDTWLFKYSDTLIRLFPMRFWQDVFIAFGVLAVGSGAFLGWWAGIRKPRN